MRQPLFSSVSEKKKKKTENNNRAAKKKEKKLFSACAIQNRTRICRFSVFFFEKKKHTEEESASVIKKTNRGKKWIGEVRLKWDMQTFQ